MTMSYGCARAGARVLLAALWTALVSCTWACAARAGTTWYVCSGITGTDPGGLTGADAVFDAAPSDANAGTDPAHPLLTLGAAGLQGRMADGDVAYLSGRFYIPDATKAAFFTALSCNNRRFAQWADRPAAMIRGGNKAGTDGWSRMGVSAFAKNIGAGLGPTLATVVFDYDSATNIGGLEGDGAITGVGRRMSHLSPATEADVLGAGPGWARGLYHYDDATGELVVSLPWGVSPASARANGVEYSVRGRNAFYLASDAQNDRVNTGNAFTGLRFALWADGGSASPCGSPIAVSNGDRTTISACVFEDSGLHSYSFGQRCTDNVCVDNVHVGMAPNGIACVFNAGGFTGGQLNRATGCRIVRDVVFANSLLTHDGSQALGPSPVGAFICHGPAADIELENFQVREYTPPGGAVPDVCAQFTVNDAPGPGDRFDAGTYAVRVRQTDPSLATIDGGTAWPNQGVTSNAAFVNCVFRFPRTGAIGVPAMIDVRSTQGLTAFFGCTFEADLGNLGGPASMFAVGPQAEVLTVNCSGYDRATGHGPYVYSLFRFAGGGFYTDVQSVWGFRESAPGLRYACVGDADVGLESHLFRDTAFWNVGPRTYSQNAEIATSDLWDAAMLEHTGGVTLHLDADPVMDPTGEHGLAPSGAFASLQKTLDVHAARGVNGSPYDGRYGAYQYGGSGCPADVDGNGFVNGDDFDQFSEWFFWGYPEADFDGNGFVNGEDFDAFAIDFDAGC